MKKILTQTRAFMALSLMSMACWTASLSAQESLPYRATFEAGNGFAPGNIHGQRGFAVVRGEAEVIQGTGIHQSNALMLRPSRPFGIVQLNIDAGLDVADSPDGVVHTEFMIRPGAGDLGEGDQFADVEGSISGFFKIDDAGELYLFDGGGEDQGGQWLSTGTRFELDETDHSKTWITLSVRQDFESKLWDVAINGAIFRANLAMAQPEPSLKKIEFIGQSRMPLYIDDIRVSRDSLAFDDSDRDGLPDAWERVHGLRAGQAGRDDDPDSDGLTNVEEWVLATSPAIPDTDGDGVSDGDEYFSGSNPLEDDDGLVAAASVQSGHLILSTYSCGERFAGFQVSLYGGSSDSITGIDYVYAYTVPTYQMLNWPYYWVSGGNGEIWLGSSTYVEDGRLYLAVRASDGNLYTGFFGFSCGCECGCLDVWSVGSVDFKLALGSMDFGRFGQYLHIKEPTWTDKLFSRKSVRYAGAPETRGLSYDGAVPILDWVKTDTQFTKLSDVPHGYLVESYQLDQVGENNEVTGEPFKRYRIENPDPRGLEAVKRLRISEEIGRPSVREYRFREHHGVTEWELYEGSRESYLERPLRYTRMTSTAAHEFSTRKNVAKTIEVHEKGHWDESSGRLVLDEVTRKTYRHFPFGSKLVEVTRDPDEENLTTQFGYREDFRPFDPKEDPGGFAQLQLQWEEHPDGGWVWYGYDDHSRRSLVVTPVGNTPRPTSLPGPGQGYKVIQTTYSGDGLSKTVTSIVHGVTESITSVTESTLADGLLKQEERVRRGDYVESIIRLRDPKTGRLVREEKADGMIMESTMEELGDLRTERRFVGGPSGESGTVTQLVTHRSGLVLEKKVTDAASLVVTMHEKVLDYDGRFRALLTSNEIKGKVVSAGYDCCGESWLVNEDGSATVHERDVLGRIVATNFGFKDALVPGNTLDVNTSKIRYSLDGLDRRIVSEQAGDDGFERNSREYNLAGQMVRSSLPGGVDQRHKTVILDDGGRVELLSLPKSGWDQRYRISSRMFDLEGRLVREREYAASLPFSLDPDPGTQTKHLVYDESFDTKGRYVEVTDIASVFDQRTRRTYFNDRGQRSEIVHGYGSDLEASETYTYDEKGLLVRRIDPDGVVTRYAYDESSERNITAVDLSHEPGEVADHIDYNVDRITRTTRQLMTDKDDEAMHRTIVELFTEQGPVTITENEQTLDGMRSTTVQNGLRAGRRRIEGEAPGWWSIVVTQPNGSSKVDVYKQGRLARETRYDSDGTVVSWLAYTYDGFGRLSTSTDSRNGTTTYEYDEHGRKWKVSEPNPTTGSSSKDTLDTRYYYDALGQLVKTTRPGGGAVHRVFNANGSLHRIYGHHTADVTFRYNGRGERTHMVTSYGANGESSETRWAFNELGRLSFKQDAHGRRVRYSYTPGGKLQTRTWARGVTTSYHYDADNHVDLRMIGYSDGTNDVHFSYNRIGLKLTVEDSGGLTTYTYREDAPTVVHSETTGTAVYSEPKTLTYLRDDLGRSRGFQVGTTGELEKDYSVGYGYDSAGRLKSVHAHGYWFEYAYEPYSNSDLVKTIVAPFVKKTEFQYEQGRDRIVSVSNRVGFRLQEEFASFAYTHDSDGKRIARATNHGDDREAYLDRFTYDPHTGGLSDSFRRGGQSEQEFHYDYDKIGNRLGVVANGDETRYETNALNQSREAKRRGVDYDEDGNLSRDGLRTFTWDAENRLVAIHERGSLVAEYFYDHQSRRIARRVRGGTDERYLYHGWNLVAVYDGRESEPTETYTWGRGLINSVQGGVGGLLFAKARDHSEITWIYHYDANGNVVGVTDPRGKVLDRIDYDPFGNVIGEVKLAHNRFRFSTKPADDESGWYNYGYRQYDPRAGAWLSRDPIEEQGGVNLYAFVNNDSVNLFDVLGLQNSEAFEIVSKSYINGVGSLGSLPADMKYLPLEKLAGFAAASPFVRLLIAEIASRIVANANTRLSILASVVGGLDAFNQDPRFSSKDGEYRLFTKISMKVCCEDGKAYYKNDTWEKDGGQELPGIDGTIWLRYRFIDQANTFRVVWTGWGRPNILVEPGMQWVGHRNDKIRGLSIWHEGTVTVSCNSSDRPEYTLDSYLGSKYPTRRVWLNGSLKKTMGQRNFSDLWTEHASRSGYVK